LCAWQLAVGEKDEGGGEPVYSHCMGARGIELWVLERVRRRRRSFLSIRAAIPTHRTECTHRPGRHSRKAASHRAPTTRIDFGGPGKGSVFYRKWVGRSRHSHYRTTVYSFSSSIRLWDKQLAALRIQLYWAKRTSHEGSDSLSCAHSAGSSVDGANVLSPTLYDASPDSVHRSEPPIEMPTSDSLRSPCPNLIDTEGRGGIYWPRRHPVAVVGAQSSSDTVPAGGRTE
jgi:hypothetical protein